MNKKYLLGGLIVAFLIVGAACTNNDGDNGLNNGVENQTTGITEGETGGQVNHGDWKTYSNEEYGFKMMYPEKYKTVEASSAWPNSLIHFIESTGSPQSYRATISVWDNLDDYRASTVYSAMRYFSHNSTDGKKIVKSYMAMRTETDLIEEWEEIIDTFETFVPENSPANTEPAVDNGGNETVSTTNCTKQADLINKYGCHPSMTCGDGEVCREGLCVDEADAPNEYGCHPTMMCDKGQECRKGVCVNAIDAPDPYGCHPTMNCGDGEVCRSGACIKVCE